MDEMQRPIGVFDSGVGGISVLRELVALMPNENFIFYGDSKNAPYGTKTLEEVRKLTLADAEYLRSRNVKALVVACNTATSAAIHILREKYQKEIPGFIDVGTYQVYVKASMANFKDKVQTVTVTVKPKESSSGGNSRK